MSNEMKPILGVGTQLEISGHPAKVTQITREGVLVAVAGRQITVYFDEIEKALNQAKK